MQKPKILTSILALAWKALLRTEQALHRAWVRRAQLRHRLMCPLLRQLWCLPLHRVKFLPLRRRQHQRQSQRQRQLMRRLLFLRLHPPQHPPICLPQRLLMHLLMHLRVPPLPPPLPPPLMRLPPLQPMPPLPLPLPLPRMRPLLRPHLPRAAMVSLAASRPTSTVVAVNATHALRVKCAK